MFFFGPHVATANDRMVGRPDDDIIWKGPTIRRGAMIGTGAILASGVEIGEGSVVGMQSLVTRNVPPFTTVLGVPARPRQSNP